MDRRQFFRNTLQKSAKTVVKQGDARVPARASHWIRPPFAISELEFLLTCTRCTDCAEACPHGVVFPLAAKRGADVAGTPALNLLHQGCHMCTDWPCVAACSSGALKIPETRETGQVMQPLLARVSINTETCLPYLGPECGVCVDSCPVPGALQLRNERPVIDDTLCTGCAMCREACIVEGKAIFIKSIYHPGDGIHSSDS